MTDTADITPADNLSTVSALFRTVEARIGEFVVGHRPLIALVMTAFLSEGHILIEGAPGTAKTIIAKGMAQLVGCEFRRIQCAVDTQPADIVGVRIYDAKKKDFVLKRGPLFANFLLIDEINRLSPKTQSAFIEAMSERQATIDGNTEQLPAPFIAIATQNPYEYEGTFPLIEAQKDRFMVSVRVAHLSKDEELQIVQRSASGALDWERFYAQLIPLADADRLSAAIAAVEQVHMEPPVLQYIRDIVTATRSHGDVHLGASARASIALVRSSRATAALAGRAFVLPDDVKLMAVPVLRHRLMLTREAELAGRSAEQITGEILGSVEVP
jgi:MoxR-like ATPase